MEIHFSFQKAIRLPNRIALKKFIQKLFDQEKIEVQTINYIFCSDEYLLRLNIEHLNHNYFTDIITFDLSASKKAPKIGEVYISVDTVCQNAQRFFTTNQNELHRVIFHGALHLCGYKDKTPKEKILMKNKEEKYLSLYFNVQ
ncbi:MAG: rRNA maturation RNase YbeY [Ferruginibacter sp.]